MRITDLLDKRSISLNETPKTKSEALDRIIDLMVASGKINDREAYREQVYAREEESTTGIGEGIAIPHGSKRRSRIRRIGRTAGYADVFDRSAEYERYRTFGRVEQAVGTDDG